MRSIRFSAFVEDMRLDALPKGVQEDIARFVSAKGHHLFPHYGMVVRELLPKADPANLKSARKNVRTVDAKKAQDAVIQATKKGEKYVLLLNDRIIDGHHFLAKAERGRVTGSLNVLDLTPARFQFGATEAVQTFAAGSGVAQDRYRKSIRENDNAAAQSHYARAAISGAALGLALRKKMGRKAAAAAGAGGAIAAQSVVRHATAGTKDTYGERSATGKKVDALAPVAIGAAALVAGKKRIAAKAATAGRKLGGLGSGIRRGARGVVADVARSAIGLESREEVVAFAARKVAGLLRSKKVRTGAALAGGIAAADAVTSATMPENEDTRTGAAAHGLKKGAIYGGALAIAEPVLHGALVKAARRVKFGAQGRNVELAAYDERHGSTADGVQAVQSVVNRGRAIHRYGSRASGLVRDAKGALAGQAKTDSRGRPVKREWEKQWFKNAAGTAAVTTGLLVHSRYMRKSPAYRTKVEKAVQAGRNVTRRVVSSLTGMSARRCGEVQFDSTAPDWDVRDQRGRSARVFAPGARPRERREKYWHERVDNIRRVAIAGAIASALGGGFAGYRIGAKRTASALTPTKPAAPKAWQKPGYQTKKVKVVSRGTFRKAGGGGTPGDTAS